METAEVLQQSTEAIVENQMKLLDLLDKTTDANHRSFMDIAKFLDHLEARITKLESKESSDA